MVTSLIDDFEARDTVAARHDQILLLARQAGSVEVDELAIRFGVTPQTIRKDLNILAKRAMLARVHGGAIITSGVDNIGYDMRRDVASEAKAAIGKGAAALIPNGASLFINIGTTTEAVAEQLLHHTGLMVISNNLNVIDILNRHVDIDIVAVGGQVRQSDRAIVGPLAMGFIETFKVDFALIGASAIDSDGSLLDFAIDEVPVSQTIVRNARQVILVADSSKIGRPAPVRIGAMEVIDHFVTDRIDDPQLRAACERHNVNLVETQAWEPKRSPRGAVTE